MNDINQQQEQSEGPFQRAAHQVFDKIDPLSFGRSLAATAVGLARHPLSLFSAYQNFAVNALGAAQAVASRMVGATSSGDRRRQPAAWLATIWARSARTRRMAQAGGHLQLPGWEKPGGQPWQGHLPK